MVKAGGGGKGYPTVKVGATQRGEGHSDYLAYRSWKVNLGGNYSLSKDNCTLFIFQISNYKILLTIKKND